MFVSTRYRFAQPGGRSPRWEGETKVWDRFSFSAQIVRFPWSIYYALRAMDMFLERRLGWGESVPWGSEWET